MKAINQHRESHFTRRLYETSIVFAFAILIALVTLLAAGARTHGRFTCAAKSIATASAHCGAAEIGHDLPPSAVSVVFSADPGLGDAER